MAAIAMTVAGCAAPRQDFVGTYRCPVLTALERIHQRGPKTTSRNRFAIVSIEKAPQRYVQCIFFDGDVRMFCEASSGAYGPVGEADHPLTEEGRAALKSLGFTQADPQHNFTRTVDLGEPPRVEIAADMMLETLARAYGARMGTRIEVTAPLGRGAEDRCGVPAS